jgi:MFS transporter, DHA1 family, multidrug resistance protein
MEGRFMGTFGIFDFIGFGVGPVLAGAIRDRADIQTVFLSMALLFAASTVVVALLLPSRVRRATAPPGEPDDAPVVLPPWSTIVGHGGVQALFAIRTAFACAMGASMSFIAIHLEESLLVTATMVGVVLAGQQVAGGIAQPFVGAVADRLPRRTLVLVGSVMASAGYSTAAVSDSYTVILLGFIIGVGIGGALTNVSAQAVQVVLGRRLGMATVGSVQSMAFATGMLLGSLGGGLVAQALSVPWVFAVGGGTMIIGALAFAWRTHGLDLEAGLPVGPLAASGTALDVGSREP